MTEQLITFETAKLAKEKEFDKGTSDCYDNNGHTYKNGWCERLDDFFKDQDFYNSEIKDKQISENYYTAPLQYELQKWLREVHGIHIKIDDFLDQNNNTDWDFEIAYIGTDIDERGNYIPEISFHVNRSFKTYEQALEKGLQEALKLIQ